jgi:outer membrane protein, heavy metal efflux system
MINKKGYLFLVAIVLSLSVSVTARPLIFNTIDELIAYGVQRNPQLEAQELQWEASQSLPKKLGSLGDPMFGLRLNGSPAKNGDDSFDQKRYVLTQDFPFFGKLTHLKELGQSQERLAYIEFSLTHNQIVFSIESLVYRLILTDELIHITEKNKESLTQLSNIAEVKYQAGLGIQANVLKAYVSKGRLEEEWLSLQHQHIVLMEQLKKMLNVDASTDITLSIKGPLLDDSFLPTLNQEGVLKSLVVQKYEAMKQSKAAHLYVEKDRYLPNVSAQVEYWDNAGADNQYAGQVMLSLPWFNAKNSASVKESERVFKSSQYSVKESINEVQSTLISLVSDINTTHKKLLLYDTQLLKDAGLSFLNFQQSFEVNKASFIDYFEAEQTLFQLEKNYAVLKNNYYIQHAALRWQFEKGELPYE